MSYVPNQELIALQLIAENASPVGASRLEAVWKEQGIHKGEATAGRYLRELDRAGLTELKGKTLGRMLSDKGRERLMELQREANTLQAERELQSALDITSNQELMDLLQMRKIVECESARKAAERASPEDLLHLRATLESHNSEADGDSTRESMDFHRAIAQASQTPILIAVMNLLFDPSNNPLERALSQITKASGLTESLHREHQALVEAIEDHRPDEAAELMSAHFDTLMRVAKDAIVIF